MGLLDYFNKKELPVEKPLGVDEVNSMQLSAVTDLPTISKNRKGYMEYGDDNNYPEFLKDMYNSSPTHNAIVSTKAEIMIGEGWVIDDTTLSEEEKIRILSLLNQIDRNLYDYSLDFQLIGAMAFEIIWSLDFKKVVAVNRIDVSKLRSGEYVDGKIESWFYKRDWENRNEEMIEIKSLDLSNKTDGRQVLYVPGKKVSNDYYGDVSYIGAMDWIILESQVGLYYKSLIENGFNPSIIVKFYKKPQSQDEKKEVIRGLDMSYGGVKNAGKRMVIFSDGKELAPDIEPIDVQNVDKQFTVISDQITQKILTGERATSAELFSIAVPGQLGSGDFETKVKVFEKFVIRPDQKRFEKAINQILNLNGWNVNFKLNPFKI